MKKRLLIIVLLTVSIFLTGCTFDFSTTRGVYTTSSTTTTVAPTTTNANMEDVIAAVYARIYAELYDEIRAEVIADLSDEQFSDIYNQVMTDLLAKIGNGEIELEALSVVDLIFDIALNAATAVIGVSNYDVNSSLISLGSGVIYKKTGDTYYVVTNEHVVKDGSRFEIRFKDGSTASATLLGVDPLVDVAVLTFVSTKSLTVVPFGNSKLSKQGEIILAVGNPNGYSYFGSITMGIISGLDRYFDIDGDKVKDMFVNYIQHDAAINSGNSGGALFNLKGEVIGINVIKIAATEIEGMGFAIPGDLVARICSDIEIYGVSRQVPVLGITFVDIKGNPEYFAYYNIPIPSTIKNGFYVTAVTLNASLYGYAQVGDIVTQIGDVVIIDTLDFKANFSKYRVGDIIDVIVYRNGAYLTLENIVLRARP
jgi:S1-C subfamily serine protease